MSWCRVSARGRALFQAALASVALASVAIAASPAGAAVVVDAGTDVGVSEGAPFAGAAVIADDIDGGTPGWSYTVDYGDGSGAVAGTTTTRSVPLAHLYADGPAARTLTVTVTDAPGETATDTALVTVANVAPTGTSTGAPQTPEGAPYALTLAGTDPAGVLDPLLFAVNWNDGSLSPAVLFDPGVVGHVFVDDEDGPLNATVRNVQITVYDDADMAVQAVPVAVLNVAPTVALSGAASVEPGLAYALGLGAKVDPGRDSATATTVAWGDGAVEPATPGTSASHVYAAAGSYTIRVSVTDEDGTFVAGSLPVAVALKVPGAPTGLTATATSRSTIRLAWANASATQTAVLVERCKGVGCTRFSQIATLAGSATSFLSTGLSANTSYTYRLRARNAAGTSAASTTATARTFR